MQSCWIVLYCNTRSKRKPLQVDAPPEYLAAHEDGCASCRFLSGASANASVASTTSSAPETIADCGTAAPGASTKFALKVSLGWTTRPCVPAAV